MPLSRRSLLGLAPLAVAGLVLAPVAACGGRRAPTLELLPGPEAAWPDQVVLAPAVLLHADQVAIAPDGLEVRSRAFLPEHTDATQAPDPAARAMLDVFYANLYVGKVWHGGGYELLPEVGNQVRSLGLTFSQGRAYAEQALQWTDATLPEVLALAGRSWVAAPAGVEAALRPPAVRSVRGTGPLDGGDNQNLPRRAYQPEPLDPTALPALPGQALLVPVIVHYYAHNGGWFVGQSNGCPAGARFRLLWVLYDVPTGAVRTWGDVSARAVERFFYTPNDVQLQDYLLRVEADMRLGLERQLAP